jgi:hypothetical protein
MVLRRRSFNHDSNDPSHARNEVKGYQEASWPTESFAAWECACDGA